MIGGVLVVCVGNICRSPMGEALLTDRLKRLSDPPRIASAGLGALVGEGADPIAVELLKERGIDLSGHRARQLSPDMLREYDLILVMEAKHQRAIEAMSPAVRGRVRRIGHFDNFDVPDPYRRGRPAFESALALIERGVDSFETKFWSKL